MMRRNRFSRAVVMALSATLFFGCGGSSGDGSGSGSGTVAVTGMIAAEGGTTAGQAAAVRDSFRVRATGATGSTHFADTDSIGRFTLMLPANDWYVMGFDRWDMMGSMQFMGHMTFRCDPGDSDRLFLSGRERAIDLGTMTLSRDGRFARPARNPLDQLDRDGDGVSDARDPDFHCGDVGDRNGDGFYDDDMDRRSENRARRAAWSDGRLG